MSEADAMGWDAITLQPDDDVAVALRPLAAGEEARVRIGGAITTVTLISDIALGHKFAVNALAQNAFVRKYGHPIGRMVEDCKAGEHVHTHNLKSARAVEVSR